MNKNADYLVALAIARTVQNQIILLESRSLSPLTFMDKKRLNSMRENSRELVKRLDAMRGK